MSDINFYLQNAWRRAAGLPEIDLPAYGKTQLKDVEANVEVKAKHFMALMRNRLLMGTYRYQAKATKAEYKYIDGLKLKLKAYEETGNTELLVDIANYALLEFEEPSIEGAHFTPLDDANHLNKKR